MRQSPSSLLLVTGIPGAGAAFAGALLDQVHDTVCLQDPPELGLRGLLADCATATTYVIALDTWLPLMRAQIRRGERPEVPRALSDDGLLAVALDGVLAGVLPELATHTSVPFCCIVRHPVDTILEWWRHGWLSSDQLKGAARFWSALETSVRDAPTLLDASVGLYQAFALRCMAHADRGPVIRYEQLVDEPSTVAELVGRPLLVPPASPPLDDAEVEPAWVDELRERLHAVGGPLTELYPDLA